MNKFLIASALFVFSFAAQAQSYSLEQWQNAVVKIYSYPCLTKRPVFEGSGLVINSAQKISVLTSEHVLLHSQSPSICHDVQTDGGARIKARLLRVSYFSGLASLEPLDQAELNGRALNLNLSPSNSKALSLTALGFPQGAQQIQVLTQGQLLSEKSQRSLIPGVQNIIEAARLPVEYGMSGGLLLKEITPGQFSFSGILSHQILKRDPSQGAHVEINQAGSLAREGDLTLAISSGDVSRWLAQKPAGLDWIRDVDEQIAGREALLYGPFKFTMTRDSAQNIFSIGGHAMGGADGSGIGGSDGSGIGGASVSPENLEILNTVEVNFSNQATADDKNQNLANGLLNAWRIQKLRGLQVRVPFLRAKEDRLLGFQSLSQFLSLWLKEQNTPVTLHSKSDDQLMGLAAAARDVVLLSQKLRDQASTPDTKAWLAIIRDQSLSAQAGLVSSQELEKLLSGEHAAYWQAFYTTDFDQAVALSAQLQKLIQTMKNLGL